MNDQINAYVQSLFANAPHKKRILDVRDELLSDLTEKYNDLLSGGVTPEQAFDEVVNGVGDIQSLIDDLSRDNFMEPSLKQNRGALHIAVGGAACILGVMVFFVFMGFQQNILAVVSASVFLAFAIGNFIYGSGLKQPQPYQKEDDSFVEEYKQKYSQPSRNTRLRSAASGLLWILVVITYFLVSFLTVNLWSYTWVIFLVGAVLQQVISSIFSDKKQAVSAGMIYTTSVIVYLVLSFGTHKWEITWLVFLGAVAVDQFIRFLRVWREK